MWFKCIVTPICKYLLVSLLTTSFKKCMTHGHSEFGKYDITSFDLDGNCSYLLHLSPEAEWIYGGTVTLNPIDNTFNKNAPKCTRVNVILASDYTLEYTLQFYVEEVISNSSLKYLNGTKTTLDAFDYCVVNSSCTDQPICSYCRTDGHTYTSNGPNVRLTFSNRSTSMVVVFTLFREAYLCKSFEYACANHKCIFHSLNCNGYNPCGDHSDCQISYAAMATIAFGGFCSLGVLFLLLFMVVKTRTTSLWNSREIQPKSFSPAKALQTIQSFTPATVTILPLQRRWSYKY